MIRILTQRITFSTGRLTSFIYNRGKWPTFRLNFSDLTFISGFRAPKSASFETGDRWRLYSEPADNDGKKVEVMVGVLEHSPSMLGQVSVGSARRSKRKGGC